MKSKTSSTQANINDDDYLVKIMAKWPNVPEVYGWLKKNKRGEWLIKGQSISHLRIREFLNKNYFQTLTAIGLYKMGPRGYMLS